MQDAKVTEFGNCDNPNLEDIHDSSDDTGSNNTRNSCESGTSIIEPPLNIVSNVSIHVPKKNHNISYKFYGS